MSITSVRVTLITKKRLDKYKKKSGTHDNIICSFLDYFDSTGIKPSDMNLSPISLVKDATERTIKILRNIETKKINHIIIQNEFIIKELSGKKEIKENGKVTDEEAEQLLGQIEVLEKQLISKDNEIKILNKKVSDTLTVSSDNNTSEILKDIKKCVLEIDDKKTSSNMKKSDFMIEKNMFKRNIDTILNLINNA